MIAAAIMAMSVYFMWHATVLPIGWNGVTGGPGGGSFPFWLSAIMFVCAGGILVRSLMGRTAYSGNFFDPDTLQSVASVTVALIVTVAIMQWLGAYVAIPLFMLWYLRIFGRRGWAVTAILTIATPVALFFFFEVTLKILLPKGITEPFFLPLYAAFF
jgi:hypothetical protein